MSKYTTIPDLVGRKFNRWSVIRFSHRTLKQAYWLCLCDCGVERVVKHSNLMNGTSGSCGCFVKQKLIEVNTKHGLKNGDIYNVWRGIKRRCYEKGVDSYERYGGVGVRMCQEWLEDPAKFAAWLLSNQWSKGMHVCRKGDIGDYSPDNCYISTPRGNVRDKKSNSLNMWKARLIRIMHRNHGWSGVKQSEFWGVTQQTICDVIKMRSWAS